MKSVEIAKIRKRDGRVVPFDNSKIAIAIDKAFRATGRDAGGVIEPLVQEVIEGLKMSSKGIIPSVEDVQDAVEGALIGAGYVDVAKAYILYRKRRTEVREAKKLFGVEDDLKLTVNAISVLERRYLLKDEQGSVIERPSQLFRRVAKAVAQPGLSYGEDVLEREEAFYSMMAGRRFLPNSPALMNGGTRLGQLSACFVLPVGDSIPEIFDGVKYMALIHQSGGGTGFSFSHLRPKGDIVRSTQGIASGPVSFMRVYDTTTDVIKQGGRRRGANMGILRVDHPDVEEFIACKADEGFLSNFNISVAVTDEFMEKAQSNGDFELRNPRNGEVVKKVSAGNIFDLIATMAWRTGDPGLVFIDEINRHNPTPKLGTIESTNPCGELPLLPYESCVLASINLSKMVEDGKIDWDRIRLMTRAGVHFLDNIIDVSRPPLAEIERMMKGNRKIGLGVMGFADMLLMLGVPYDSEEALAIAEKVMSLVSKEAIDKSVELAKQRGPFPNFKESVWPERGYGAVRNASLTAIAPTGTVSIIAGCSSGIEPLFAVSYVRNILEGTRLIEVNPIFEEVARKEGFYSDALMTEIAKKGTIQGFEEVPSHLRRFFVTALDIAPDWHVRMQAAFQKHVDNAVSKTVNLPPDATMDDVKKVFRLAFELKCKGITVYRYGVKKDQVLSIGAYLRRERGETLGYVVADPTYAGGCPEPSCNLY